jgi:hypothetical protein
MAKQSIILAIATTSILTAGTAWAADAATVVEGAGTIVHAGALILLTWCLASVRISRRNGQLRIGFELSPVRRVRALSTVHEVKRGTRG